MRNFLNTVLCGKDIHMNLQFSNKGQSSLCLSRLESTKTNKVFLNNHYKVIFSGLLISQQTIPLSSLELYNEIVWYFRFVYSSYFYLHEMNYNSYNESIVFNMRSSISIQSKYVVVS